MEEAVPEEPKEAMAEGEGAVDALGAADTLDDPDSRGLRDSEGEEEELPPLNFPPCRVLLPFPSLEMLGERDREALGRGEALVEVLPCGEAVRRDVLERENRGRDVGVASEVREAEGVPKMAGGEGVEEDEAELDVKS